MIPSVLAVTTASVAASAVLTGVVRSYTIRRGLLDRPNERSSHANPTPRGGGLAIIIAATLGFAIAVQLGVTAARDALTLGAGMLALGGIGWIDDRHHVAPATRLVVHLLVALWTLWRFHGLPSVRVGTLALPLGAAGYAVGVLAIVWSINLFNFMDGIDGLAGSEAVLIFSTAACLLLYRGDASLGAMSAALAASVGGFLIWNWPPAKIFMGDVGSGTIGYLTAGIAIGAERHGSMPLVAFVIVGGVFLADATVTLLRRIRRGARAAQAHRDHAYQRLSRAWGSHRAVTLAAGVTTLALSALAVAGTLTEWLMIPALAGAVVLLAVLLFAAERRAPM